MTLWRPRLKRIGLITIGLLTLSVIVLSFVELWVINSVDYVPGYGSSPADARGWPGPDLRGAFLVLNEPHSAKFTGNLVELLSTSEPGVVDTTAGAHLLPAEIKSILVQSAILGEKSDYRVYRIGEPEVDQMTVIKQPGGKVLLITPAVGTWKPGAYLVDIPAEGMFGGRSYFQFYVDPAAK